MKKYFILVLIFFFYTAFSQNYIPGNSYFGEKDYIEYIAGNLPIIISAPHGGGLEPNDIPDRDCSGCVYVKDSFTEELIRDMQEAIFNLTGCYPHVIINRLHRRKLDANRAIGEAADGDAQGEQAWHDFHDFIESARDSVAANFNKGIYLDLHGHGHEVQRLELGYLISKSELQQTEEMLDTPDFIDGSSIKELVYNNLNNLLFSDLLRGENSFGEFYEKENYPAVPSKTDPFPFSDESYFSGGYNTKRYGSNTGETIDAIQIECNMDGVRDTENNRAAFAEATALVIKKYLEEHYFGTGFLTGACGLTANKKVNGFLSSKINIFPNPVNDILTIEINENVNTPIDVFIYNNMGQLIFSEKEVKNNFTKINMNDFLKGFYFLKISTGRNFIFKKIIK